MDNETVRIKNPLVHCITNYVTAGDVANVLLACGASPIMVDDRAEVAEITAMSSALVLNIGTLNARTVESMLIAGSEANARGIPVVLDPVGAGASAFRNETVKRLIGEVKMTVIRGNLSEMSFIVGLNSSTRGVDASDSDNVYDAKKVAWTVADRFRCVAAVTGAEDIVTDGKRTARIGNGTPAMSKITGTGCMLTGLIGAYTGAVADAWDAAVTAVSSMGIAGEIAEKNSGGTSSMRTALIDAIGNLDDGEIEKRKKVVYE